MQRSRVLSPAFALLVSVFCAADLLADPPVSGTAAPKMVSECSLGSTSALKFPDFASTLKPAVEICGTCGQDLCDNRNVGAVCYDTLRAMWGWCIPPWGGYCSDNRPNCQCAKEYQ